MKQNLILIMAVFLIVSCNSKNPKTKVVTGSDLPKYDHIVIIVEENKDYDEVRNEKLAPYINRVLRAEGANFTQMYGEEHHSQGNYFWLFSGFNQNVGFEDVVPDSTNNPNYPFSAPNMASELIAKGYTFCGYAESLPYIGCDTTVTYTKIKKKGVVIDSIGLYGRKHVPWISFSNVPDSLNKRFADFPKDTADFKNLPTVSFVIPNLDHDMHNGPDSISVPLGDDWLYANIDPYYQWAKKNNSLLIITFDENDDHRHIKNLTNPNPKDTIPDTLLPQTVLDTIKDKTIYNKDYENRVVTIFAGAHIKKGDYAEGKGMTHVNILRTIEAIYGLSKAGKQQINATNYKISDTCITDVFTDVRRSNEN